MCGRFALHASKSEIKTQFQVDFVPDIEPLFNIAPSQKILILMQSPDGLMNAEMFVWGLIPYYARDKKISPALINARAETIATKPVFRTSFKSKRGIVVMSGYFEWQHLGYKQPYYIHLKSNRLLAVAALWDTWQSLEGEVIHSCCLITTQANTLVSKFHNRMPVFLNNEQQSIWLDSQQENVCALESLLIPYKSKELTMFRVSTKVNNWRYREADAIDPI